MQREETHSVPSKGEYAGDLTSKSANWFRFQGAEQKVKRLEFLPQQECSRANGGSPSREPPQTWEFCRLGTIEAVGGLLGLLLNT